MKKTIYNLLVIVSFLTCFYPNTGKGQEFIVEFLSLKHDYSIIRESGFNQWLLCNNYDGLQIIALADLSGTANYIARGDGYNRCLIKDIEIVDSRYVYYCGSRVISYTIQLDNQGNWIYTPTWGAMFGCFDLASFTTPNVQGIDDLAMFYFESLDKLEVYQVDGETHLVMVGSKNNSCGIVVDFYGTGAIPNAWAFRYEMVDGEKFDDVAISEDHLIVSSRNPDMQSYLRSFAIPTSVGQTIFDNPVAQIKTSISANDTILLEYCEGGYFALATTDLSTNSIEIAAFDYNLNFYQALTIPLTSSETPLYSLRDIRYNPYTQSLAVLEVIPIQTFYSSIIHHLSTNNAPPTLSNIVNGTLYKEARLCSLDYEFNNIGHIVASGCGENTFARIYQHFPYQQENCTTDNITYCNVLKLQKSNCHTLSYTPDSYTTSLINWNADYWLEAIICP